MINKDIYGSIYGHWGDCLLSIQKFKEIMGDGNIVYLGDLPDIVDFLKSQPFIHEVIHIKERHHPFTKLADSPKWKDFFVQRTGLKPEQLVATHLCDDFRLFTEPTLNPSSIEWADNFRAQMPEVFFLIQPYSFASTKYKNHWPYWNSLIKELVEYSPFHFVLVGHGWVPEANITTVHPRLINLVNQIPNLQCVFALANQSNGVITTSNSLAHWTAVSKTPTTVICNNMCSKPDYYFRRAMVAGGEHMNFVGFNENVATAVDKARILFPYP